MSTARKNTLVVDFSILPYRPEITAVEDFVYNTMKLEQSDALAIQFHNIHHCVYIEMVDNDKPLEYQRLHNCQHAVAYEGRKFKIPIYRDDDAVNVRVHDLPLSVDQKVVTEHLRQYGTVLSTRYEYWRNYFGGLRNGVRVFRMLLNKPVPSYIKVGLFESLVSHSGPDQVKTCRFCNEPMHPKTKCKVVSLEKRGSVPSQVAAQTKAQIRTDEFPELTRRERTSKNEKATEAQQHQQKQTKKISRDNPAPEAGPSDTSNTESIVKKVRLSTLNVTNNNPGQTTSPLPSGSRATTKNCFVALSPMDIGTEENN